jgi:hypothetical protein
MIKKVRLQILMICALLIILWCCNTSVQKEKKSLVNDSLLKDDMISMDEVLVMPSAELIYDLRGIDFNFDPQFINPASNLSNYRSLAAKTLNLGIYITDFAFLASTENKAMLMGYLDVVKSLSNELNIGEVFTEEDSQRFLNNMHNDDTLYSLTLGTYDKFIENLRSTDRNATLVTISIGGLFELMYLVSSNITDINEFEAVLHDMDNYRFLFNEYYTHAKMYQSDPVLHQILPDLDFIYKLFVGIEDTRGKTTTSNQGSTVVVHNSKHFSMSYKDFLNLRKAISNVRVKYISLQ